MQSNVVIDIDAPKHSVAELYADPRNNTAWMDDVERYEPLSGEQGSPGSSYRLVPRDGSRPVTATVIRRNLPYELLVKLDSSTVRVDVQARFTTLPDGRTRLASDEEFRFKRPSQRAIGLLLHPLVHKAHLRHLETFKQFAEQERARGADGLPPKTS